MLKFAFTRNYMVVRYFRRTSLAQSNKPDLKNILFGGYLHECLDQQSVGRLIYDRLSDPSRADKIIQVCAATGKSLNTVTFLKQSVAVAEGMQERNIRKGDFVLLVGNNSLNMNIAVVGILLLGAVAVPISHYASPGDLRHLLTFVRPKFFICEGQTLFMIRRIINSVLGPIDEKSILLLDNSKDPDVGLKCFPEFVKGKAEKWESFSPVEIKSPEEDLVFVMKSLTDGTAERGVGITHYNVLSVISRYESMKDTLSSEVILMVQKIIWMCGMYSILLSCCFGPKVVVLSEFDEEFFMKAVESHKVTTSYLYPAKIWQLYKYNYTKTYDLSSCRRIFAVGMGIPHVLIHLMKEKTGLAVKPAYGPSEMTGIVVEPIESSKEGTMGQLVPMCYAKVVSAGTNQNCGPNTPGEVCFKGPTLMKGYVNDEKATRNAIDKDGFFHTGDYGYFDEEGHILILDKLKEVIKYKNHEISPLEVEGVLKSHDSVKDCVVSGIAHPEDGYRIVGFVVLQPGKTVTAEDIHKFMENKLSEHKHLKGGVVFIPKVPRWRESGFIRRNAIHKVLSKYRLIENSEAFKQSKGESRMQGQTGKEKSSPEVKSPGAKEIK